jgi:primosomal protein N' (replication factor Y)
VSGIIAVALETPRHVAMAPCLSYRSERALAPGTLLRVPLARREVPGLVWDTAPQPVPEGNELREVLEVFDALPPLPAEWRALVDFAAAYYQRSVGELAMAVLPPELRKMDSAALARRIGRLRGRVGASVAAEGGTAPAAGASAAGVAPELAAEQRLALQAVAEARARLDLRPLLLHGVTGSGKTEVYLHAAAEALAAGRQALVLVPEINLTPQLEARFAARFPGRVLCSLHSGLTPAQRLRHWLQAHLGLADLVLGTRLAVFAPLPRLGLIVVDEEHDASFKQQEGARYSARDLAVWRAHQAGVPVLLGSATPSIETWHRVQQGRYRRVPLATRIGGGAMPQVRLLDMGRLPKVAGAERVLAPALQDAIERRIARGEQSLLLLNRRGYAPVLQCGACGWKSGCPHCSAWRVFHKGDRTLRCHHCGYTERVPHACPDCGNLDIAPIGRGTEKLAEQIGALLPAARVARVDADTTRGAGSLEQQLAAVHAGEVDVLVGTQMVAKGHDFRRVTLVAAVNPDTGLFSSDFRAPERLFALLMQAAGRAGRDAAQSAAAEMWVQTWNPGHPLYAALVAHDYGRFALQQLRDREAAGLPPFAALALIRADAKTAAAAQAFLAEGAAEAEAEASALGLAEAVRVYRPVPPPVAKVADVERMQLLLESPSRSALQRLLAAWLPRLDALRPRHKGLLRWAVDVDPVAI